MRIGNDTVARLVCELEWRSPEARHREALYVGRANFWRDIFPADLRARLEGLAAGQAAAATLPAGLGAHDAAQVQEIERRFFGRRLRHMPGATLEPRQGRFYPRGVAEGLAGVFPQDMTPLRVVGLGPEALAADFNHPLAGRELRVSARALEVMGKHGDTGGQCRHLLESLAGGGPGMQARWSGRPTDFRDNAGGDEPLARADEADDGLFYAQPRMVAHVDAACREHVEDLYAGLLSPGMAVLDLMSSRYSHLDRAMRAGQGLGPVTGLGMNAEELAANPALADRVAHDLNREPTLPFADASFDAVVASASIEYLTRPRRIIAEVARVLKPGGLFAATFSNRWFPAKASRLWSELHDFEKLGWVLDLLLEGGRFDGLETLTMRGWPRPWDPQDRYVDRLKSADPLYAAWGRLAG